MQLLPHEQRAAHVRYRVRYKLSSLLAPMAHPRMYVRERLIELRAAIRPSTEWSVQCHTLNRLLRMQCQGLVGHISVPLGP